MDKIAVLENRINELEGHFNLLSENFRQAFDYTHSDPQSSLTKVRIILEKIVFDIYQSEMKIEPGEKSIGEILREEKFKKRITPNILSRINSIRTMSNIATHGNEVTVNDAIDTLENLCEVFEWYLKRYKFKSPNAIKARLINRIKHFPENIFYFIERNLIKIFFLFLFLVAFEIFYFSYGKYLFDKTESNSINEGERVVKIKKFIKNYQSTFQLNDIDSLLYYFDDEVNFLTHPSCDKDCIRNESKKFFDEYPKRIYFIKGGEKEIIVEKKNDDLYTVKYIYHFNCEGKTIKRGNVSSVINVYIKNDRPYISSVQETKTL